MIPTHKRWEDQDGNIAKLKWIICQPFVTGILGALMVILIAWVAGIIYAMPVTYAQRIEVSELKIKHDIDYKSLDEKKMDKADYIREHLALENRMNTRFDKTDSFNNAILNAVLDVKNSQLKQYNKVNKASSLRGE